MKRRVSRSTKLRVATVLLVGLALASSFAVLFDDRRMALVVGGIGLAGVTALLIALVVTVAKRGRQLVEREANLRTMLESSPPGLIIAASDGRVVSISAQSTRLSGFTLEEYQAASVAHMWVDQKEREAFVAILERDGHVRDYEAKFRRWDGTEFWALCNSSFVRIGSERLIATWVQDVTERRRMLEQIQDGAARLQAVLDEQQALFGNVQVAVMFISDGVIVRANPKAAEVFGFGSPSEVVGQNAVVVFPSAATGAVARLDPEGKDPTLRRMVPAGQDAKHQQRRSDLERGQSQAARSARAVRPDARAAAARDVRRAAARSLSRGIHLHPVPWQLHRRAQYHRRPRPAAPDPALRPHRGGGGHRPEPGGLDDHGPALGGRQHVAAPPLHPVLQEIPVAPSVTANSIVAVEGDAPVEQGNDGVVEYSSAHIEPVESELIVKSSHSTQGNPHTIEEVRRILRLHVGLKLATVSLEPK